MNTETNTSIPDINAKEVNENQLEQQVNNLKEQLLRASADFENFRRRTEKERIEWMNITRSTTIRLFLPIVDDIQRALDSMPQRTPDLDSTIINALDGLSLIQKNVIKALESSGVEEISTIGTFDPEFHEALMQVEDPEKKGGSIVQVFEKGYKLGTNIIRHAKVSVSK
jgi:molecular chaperone GrpE